MPPDISTSTGGGGIGSLFNVLIALGIVYGLLRFAMPKIMARMNKRLVTSTGSAIRVEESASFAGGSLFVVSARGKTLLLSVSSQGVQNLADLTEIKPSAEPQTFSEIVDKAVVFQTDSTLNTQHPTPNTQPSTPNTDPDWAVALERLERLAS